MKSVGEVMGIGRTFEEAYQKAIRMLDLDFEGATSEKVFAGMGEPYAHPREIVDDIIARYLYTPTPKRMFVLPLAMRHGISIEQIREVTGINAWFLLRIRHIVALERTLQESRDLSAPRLRELKQMGVSDKRIGELVGMTGLEVRALRKQLGITPFVFQIDTLGAEFPAETNYLYTTYNAQHHDVEPTGPDGVIFVGSGPYRIGSSVE